MSAPTAIHPSAVVDPGAVLGEGVRVGPFAYVGPEVEIGDGTVIGPHCTVTGPTRIGRDNVFVGHAAIGGDPQDKKFKGERVELLIGDRNTFREFCTVNRGTGTGNNVTRVGNDNWLLAYTHVAHDCIIGDHCVFSNNATLAGHVEVGDYVILSGFAGIHQFCRIGDHAMVAACSKCVQDVPPFVIADGNPCETKMINAVGLKRSGFTDDEIATAKLMHRLFYRDGLNTTQAIEKARALPEASSRVVKAFVDFAASTKRGLA